MSYSVALRLIVAGPGGSDIRESDNKSVRYDCEDTAGPHLAPAFLQNQATRLRPEDTQGIIEVRFFMRNIEIND